MNRRKWIADHMAQEQERIKSGLPESYLYDEDTKSVTIQV
jgi:hypothetical protein